MSDQPRPLFVTLISLLYGLGAAIMILAAVASLLGFTVMEDIQSGAIAAGTCLVIALVCLVMFAGFWKGWNLWWYLGVLFTFIGAIAGIVNIVTGNLGYIPTLFIDILVLFYLFKPNVKRYFLD